MHACIAMSTEKQNIDKNMLEHHIVLHVHENLSMLIHVRS